MSQDLVDLNAVDPQQQQAGCVTSDAPPDQPAVDMAVGTTKAASALSASLSKHMITQANSASCAAENATAIDKVNASTLRHYARGVAASKVDAKAAKVGAAEVGAAECAPERVKVRNVTPERHPSQDLAIIKPVDPQQQQISDNKADCESWTHSWQAPLSNAGITPSDTPPEQPSVDVAVDTTIAAEAGGHCQTCCFYCLY